MSWVEGGIALQECWTEGGQGQAGLDQHHHCRTVAPVVTNLASGLLPGAQVAEAATPVSRHLPQSSRPIPTLMPQSWGLPLMASDQSFILPRSVAC